MVYRWTSLTRRPLRVPTIGSSDVCPISAVDPRIGPGNKFDVGPGIGDGPVYTAHYDPNYPEGLNVLTLHFPPLHGAAYEATGWTSWKHRFVVVPAYQGPVLIRGRQLDSVARVRFGDGAAATRSELRIPVVIGAARQARLTRTFSLVRVPGCYAYQVDGTTFSKLIVFQIKEATS